MTVIDERFESMEKKIEARVESIEKKIDAVKVDIQKLNNRVAYIEGAYFGKDLPKHYNMGEED